ncbi:MAG: class I SAM-dependent RNA methyltransferase [Pseudomonadota bacterium]
MDAPLEIFLACPPGLEPLLAAEAGDLGLAEVTAVAGGVEARGDWPAIWRANLWLRGATRVLVRIAQFRAVHLAQLDKRARKIDWPALLPPGSAIAVEASCRRSRIYHDRAAAERVARAAAHGASASIVATGETDAAEPPLKLLLRIESDLCTLSLDTSGAPLHRRGHKQAVSKAPMRETMAALFLRAAGYRPGETVADPMCGSGTFALEAAEITAGLAPGRDRAFAFERLSPFDPMAWSELRTAALAAAPATPPGDGPMAFGSDRDAGAVRSARENAARAGVDALTQFDCHAISDFQPPDAPPGLVIVNPPYGGRIGEKGRLTPLYGALGRVLAERFRAWRVGVVTSEDSLARATRLPFLKPGPPIPHGGLRVRLWQTDRLP